MKTKLHLTLYLFIPLCLLSSQLTCQARDLNSTGKATNVKDDTTTIHTIGESYGGGKIFWLDATGKHGLIAATADQSSGIQWYNGAYLTTDATLKGVYSGKANTLIIINIQGAGDYAAQLCNNYYVVVNNGYYTDWYLPSKFELNLLYLQKNVVGGFTNSYYWSSNEIDDYNNGAWSQSFGDGNLFDDHKDAKLCVRAIRAF